jgi:hypothetical protein
MLTGKVGNTATILPSTGFLRVKPAAVKGTQLYTVAAFLAGCIVGPARL